MTTDCAIAHLDMDCFYVSVERLHDPSLVGIPVAVGGPEGGRGVISSASYEARAFGVRSAMPVTRALQLCPRLKLVQGSMSKYSEYSRKIHDILLGFTPMVQMASQDEAYLDLTGTGRLWGPALRAAQLIRETIFRETSLPCSIGLASNKLVAKIASGLCKPSALMYIPSGSEESFLAPLPIRRIPGIGPKAAEKLKLYGVERVGQGATLDRRIASRLFGSMVNEFYEKMRGRSSDIVQPGELPKSIGGEETFGEDQWDREFLVGILSALSEKVAWRLRINECRARTIILKYRYSNFETHTASTTLPSPTNDEGELLAISRAMLEEKWDKRRPLRLVGVTGSNLVYGEYQDDFLESGRHEKMDRLHAAIDAARDRHG